MANAAVKFERVVKEYLTDTGDAIAALDNVTLEVPRNEIFCLVGPSGCGKTTLLNLAAGFVPVTTGHVLVEGEPVHAPHSRCGFAFQSDAIFPWMSVLDNVEYGLRWNGTPRHERKNIAERYLARVGLARFANRWPRELSGGMRKRVDLARVFAFNPPTLLLDEPFGLLDVMSKEDMQRLLLDIWRTEQKAVLFVTHDVEEAVYLGHRVGVMSPRPGRVRHLFSVPFPLEEREPRLKLSSEFLAIRRTIVDALHDVEAAS